MTSRVHLNPAAPVSVDLAGFGPRDRAPLDYHRRLPGYAPTPLVELVARRVLIMNADGYHVVSSDYAGLLSEMLPLEWRQVD